MYKMNAILRKDILTETYKDMQGLIFETCWRYWKQHGGNIDDLIGQANLSFIRAVDSHNETQSKLTTWIVVCIKNDLRNYMIKEYKHTHIASIDDEDVYDYQNITTPNNSFSVIELLDEMEKDAHIILQLFLETPKEVIDNVLVEGKQMNRIQRHMKSSMKKRLRNRLRQMGWTLQRIAKSFNDIKEAIS